MNKLETRILIENIGDYTDEEIDYMMDIYDDVAKNVGFKDERRDKRYIVKFHDIFYYQPKEYENDEYYDSLFEDFCEQEYFLVKENLAEEHIDINEMLTNRPVGHYEAFRVDIPEITEENVVQIVVDIFNEMDYDGANYASNYVKTVNLLQDLEDNYVEYWIQYLEDVEFPEKYIKEIKENYKKDQERRKK